MFNQLRSFLWLGVAGLVVFATAFVFAEANRKRLSTHGVSTSASAEKPPIEANPTYAAAFTPKITDAVRVVRFAVYPQGIRPSEVQVIAGPILIYMEDNGDISRGLLVRDTHGLGLGRIVREEGKHRGGQRLNLAPGQYKVFDATQPQNYATLIVK